MKNHLSKIYKCLRSYICIYIILMFCFVSLITVGAFIQNDSKLFERNINESRWILEKEGNYPYRLNVYSSMGDNFTDAIILNSCVTNYSDNPLKNAVANAYTIPNDYTGDIPTIDGILSALQKDGEIVVYSRYWAGSTLLVKIFMHFGDIRLLRSIFLVTITSMSLIVAGVIGNKIGKKEMVIYSIAISGYIPLVLYGITIAFFWDIFFSLAISLFVLLSKRIELFPYAFFICGSFIAFVNYFSFPLITIGIPLICLVSYYHARGIDSKAICMDILRYSICWGNGFVYCILFKQVLSKVVLGTQSGLSQIAFRMGRGDYSILSRIITAFKFWLGRLDMFQKTYLIAIAIVYVGVFLLFLKGDIYCIENKVYVPYLLISIYPFIWHVVLIGHGGHGYTSVITVITVYALMSMIINNLNFTIPYIDNEG